MLTAPPKDGLLPAKSALNTIPRQRLFRGLRLDHLLIVAFVIVAAVPIGILANWESRTTFEREVDAVRERHLLVARNLTSTMSRYARDLRAAFNLALESGAVHEPMPGVIGMLTALDFRHVCILGPDGRPQAFLRGLDKAAVPPNTPEIIKELRELA